MEQLINLIELKINATLDKCYTKQHSLDIRNRYECMNKGFDEIISLVKQNDEFVDNAKRYYVKRAENDDKLNSIQKQALSKLENCVGNDVALMPASSFSAKTNLVGESDLDIALLVTDLLIDTNNIKLVRISNALGKCGFMLSDIRNKNSPNIHYVFQKYIDGVEIEVKLRDNKEFDEFKKMHSYLDNDEPMEIRMLVTYIKNIIRSNKSLYSNFKMIYYSHAGFMGGSNKLLYELID